MPPKMIGPYRVLETLGSGGVGTVYKAVDRRSNETIALKLLSTGPALDPRSARRLAREFETLADLSHPNVVKVFDTGVYHGYPYLTMELIEGLTLRHYLALDEDDPALVSGSISASAEALRRAAVDPASSSQDAAPRPFGLEDFYEEAPSEEESYDSGPDSVRAWADVADEPDTYDSGSAEDLPFEIAPREERAARPPSDPKAPVNLEALNRPERVARLKDAILQLCQALSYIHGHGLVHRDLKPSNVMVDDDRTVRLMDFGLAKFLADDGAVTAEGKLVGTFRYMAPEQILGEPLDPRADLYSLGIILYELLTGRPPFDAKTPYELWQKVLETEAAPLLSVNVRADPHLARIAHRLMMKDPDERYRTAEEIFEALSE